MEIAQIDICTRKRLMEYTLNIYIVNWMYSHLLQTQHPTGNVRKCRKQATYRHNPEILCQGREDNPLHTDAFNELIENLKEKNIKWSKIMFNCERSVSRTLFMDENSDRGH